MKFGTWVEYGPGQSWLNFGSNPEYILDVVMSQVYESIRF